MFARLRFIVAVGTSKVSGTTPRLLCWLAAVVPTVHSSSMSMPASGASERPRVVAALTQDTSRAAASMLAVRRWLRSDTGGVAGPAFPSSTDSLTEGVLLKLWQTRQGDSVLLDSLVRRLLRDTVNATRPTRPPAIESALYESGLGLGGAKAVVFAGVSLAARQQQEVIRTTYERPPETRDGVTVSSRGEEVLYASADRIGRRTKLVVTAEAGGGAARRIETITTVAEVGFCPDPAGLSRGTWEYLHSVDRTAGPAALRSESRHRAELTGHVNDAAELTRIAIDLQVDNSSSETNPSGKRTTDRGGGRARMTMTPTLSPATDVYGATVPVGVTGYSTSTPELSDLRAATQLELERVGALMIAGGWLAEIDVPLMYGKARDLWRSGKCVEVIILEGAERTRLSPGERVNITAESRHKLEGSALPAPLEAWLSGVVSVTPEKSKVPPPARFVYAAPHDGSAEAAQMRRDGARVYVESISRRGIGTTDIVYRLELPALALRVEGDGRPARYAVLGAEAEVRRDLALVIILTPHTQGGLSGEATVESRFRGRSKSAGGTCEWTGKGNVTGIVAAEMLPDNRYRIRTSWHLPGDEIDGTCDLMGLMRAPYRAQMPAKTAPRSAGESPFFDGFDIAIGESRTFSLQSQAGVSTFKVTLVRRN